MEIARPKIWTSREPPYSYFPYIVTCKRIDIIKRVEIDMMRLFQLVLSVRKGLGARAAPRENCQEDWTGKKS